MVKMPFRRGKEKDITDGVEFNPEPYELELLEPFLSAEQSVFTKVRDAVLGDGRIPDERKDSLLRFYIDQRSMQIVEENKGSV